MLGSYEDSEDLVQETLLRAWRKRGSFEGRSTVRAWLYRIATNACLDFLDGNQRRAASADVDWLQPYPDERLDEMIRLDDGCRPPNSLSR
jgi:RNA polymerase sigma-70 factor (ECF subfamily)